MPFKVLIQKEGETGEVLLRSQKIRYEEKTDIVEFYSDDGEISMSLPVDEVVSIKPVKNREQ